MNFFGNVSGMEYGVTEMAYVLRRWNGPNRFIVGTYSDHKTALEAVPFGYAYYEIDVDNPGCIDVLNTVGEVYTIEPEKAK